MSRGISLNKVLASECCAPTCYREPLEDAPFPLCMRHMRQAFNYFDGFAHMAQEAIAARYPVDQDDLLARVRAAQDEVRRERQEPPNPRSQVYYAEVNGGIKIGFTVNLKSRMGAMRIPLDRVLATEPGGRELERMRHAQFKHLRRGRLEEFERADDLLSHIAMIRSHFGGPRITSFTGEVA